MNSKLSLIIVTLTLNISFLLFHQQSTYAQSQVDNQQDLLYDFLPPLPPSSRAQSSLLPPNNPYTLDQGDIIKVSVFGVAEQGGIDEVFSDGTVTFPLIGNVSVKGKTIDEVNQLMTNLYSRYLKRPSITVTLEKPRDIDVVIIGEVNTPGDYTIPSSSGGTESSISNPKVTDLFTLAGGLTVSADVKQIKLRRKEDEREIVYNLDFWRLLQEGDLAQDVNLQDGDVIVVTKNEKINPKEYRQLIDATFGIKYIKPPTVTVIGEVYRPGSYTVPLESGPPRVTSVLQQSGGIKELADIRNIVITRTTRDAEQRTITVNLWDMLQTGDVENDIILRDGDTITIPTAEQLDPSEAQALASANFSPTQIVVNVVGSVLNPGPTPVPPNTSLNNAILAAGGFNEVRANTSTVELVRVNPNGTVSKRQINVNLAAEVNEENNPILKNNDVIIINRNTLTAVGDTLNSVLSPFSSVFSFVRFFQIFDGR